MRKYLLLILALLLLIGVSLTVAKCTGESAPAKTSANRKEKTQLKQEKESVVTNIFPVEKENNDVQSQDKKSSAALEFPEPSSKEFNMVSNETTPLRSQSQPVNKAPPVPTTNLVQSEVGGGWMYLTLAVMALTTIISVSVSFYLYKWRKILLSKPNALVPEEWGKYLEKVGSAVSGQADVLKSHLGAIASSTVESTDKIANMTETFMALQGALDKRDAEINRLKRGYDAEIFRKFISRFIRIDQAIDDFLRDGEVDLKLKQLKRLFEDAFDECGVESFNPQIGEDYRSAEGIADNPKKVKTEKAEEEFMIAEVIESGYKLRAGEQYEFIVPAKVRIFALNA